MMSRAKGKKQAQTASKPTILPTPIFNRYSTATFSPFVHSKTSAVVVHLTIAELELLEYLESAAAELSYNQALKAYSFQFDCQLGDVRDTARYLGRFGFLGFDFGGHQDDPVYSVVDPNEPVPTHVVETGKTDRVEYVRGARGKFSEVDTEAYALHKLREWRRGP